MNKKILVIALTFMAGSMLQAVSENDTENHGFLASLGIGVKDILESPAHIGQGGKKNSNPKKTKRYNKSKRNNNSDQKSKRSRRCPAEEQ